jgi:hypothetical protein
MLVQMNHSDEGERADHDERCADDDIDCHAIKL